MFGENLPVLFSPRGPGRHQVAGDLHEVLHAGVVRRQAQAGLT